MLACSQTRPPGCAWGLSRAVAGRCRVWGQSPVYGGTGRRREAWPSAHSLWRFFMGRVVGPAAASVASGTERPARQPIPPRGVAGRSGPVQGACFLSSSSFLPFVARGRADQIIIRDAGRRRLMPRRLAIMPPAIARRQAVRPSHQPRLFIACPLVADAHHRAADAAASVCGCAVPGEAAPMVGLRAGREAA